MSKSLIFIDDFSKEEIYEIKLADKFADDVSQVKPLEGKTVVLFFPESSIRTRVAFEKGIQELGGKTILFPPEALDKKEKLGDVIGYLENWVDAIVTRHSDIEVVKSMAMLLTGSKEESTLNFYRNAGYNSSDKTAFIQWIDM